MNAQQHEYHLLVQDTDEDDKLYFRLCFSDQESDNGALQGPTRAMGLDEVLALKRELSALHPGVTYTIWRKVFGSATSEVASEFDLVGGITYKIAGDRGTTVRLEGMGKWGYSGDRFELVRRATAPDPLFDWLVVTEGGSTVDSLNGVTEADALNFLKGKADESRWDLKLYKAIAKSRTQSIIEKL